jgi:hypothetical protein
MAVGRFWFLVFGFFSSIDDRSLTTTLPLSSFETPQEEELY